MVGGVGEEEREKIIGSSVRKKFKFFELKLPIASRDVSTPAKCHVIKLY